MKTMNTKRYALILALVACLMTNCSDDFLDRTSQTELADDNFWTSEADAVLGLMGCYDALQSSYIFNTSPWAGGVMRLEDISDNGYATWSWMVFIGMSTGQWTPTSWGEPEFYAAIYAAVVRCNRVIEFVPQIADLDEATANQIVAEAKVIRATVYNILAMTYEDAPLVTEVLNVDNADVPKSSKEEIVAFITEDLEACIGDLPDTMTSDTWGRISKGGAEAMLARIYLYHGAYEKAAAHAKAVIDMGEFSLFDDYTTLFTTANEMNSEVLFTVAYERGLSEGSGVAAHYDGLIPYAVALPNLAAEFYCTDGLPPATSPLFNPDHESENRDPRFATTLVANGDEWQGSEVTGEDVYYWRKWAEETSGVDHFDSPQDFYVIRYAHVLLMRAEALLYGTYDETEVIGLVNQLRDRAGMPHVEDVEGTGLSTEALMDIVKHERRVETAYEGLRYFDQKRWGELLDSYAYYNENEFGNYGSEMLLRTTDTKYLIWPLPQNELDVNDALVQHAEWGGE